MLAVLTTSWARTRPKLSTTATPSRRSSTATRPNSSAMYSSALSCSRIRELVPAVCARRAVEQVDATGRWAGQRLDRHDLAWLVSAQNPPHETEVELAHDVGIVVGDAGVRAGPKVERRVRVADKLRLVPEPRQTIDKLAERLLGGIHRNKVRSDLFTPLHPRLDGAFRPVLQTADEVPHHHVRQTLDRRGAEKDFRPPRHLPTLDLAFNAPRAGQCIEVEAAGVLVDTDPLGDVVKRRCGGKPLEMLEDSSARRTKTRSVGVPHLRTPAPCCPTQVHFTMG